MIRFKFLDKYGKIRYINVNEENIIYDCECLVIKLSSRQFNKMAKYDFKLKNEEYPILDSVRLLYFVCDNGFVIYERELYGGQ